MSRVEEHVVVMSGVVFRGVVTGNVWGIPTQVGWSCSNVWYLSDIVHVVSSV